MPRECWPKCHQNNSASCPKTSRRESLFITIIKVDGRRCEQPCTSLGREVVAGKEQVCLLLRTSMPARISFLEGGLPGHTSGPAKEKIVHRHPSMSMVRDCWELEWKIPAKELNGQCSYRNQNL